MSELSDAQDVRLAPEDEPRLTGTLVILMLFLMALGALWGLMYLLLLER